MKKKAIILVMVIGILLGLLWGSKNVLGQPVSLYVYAVRDVDYVLKDGTVYKCDIFFEKADYMTNSLGRDYYDESIHTNQWYKDAKVIYCLEINGAYPYGWYNSNKSSRTESQLVNKEGYANLVGNASYRDYWSQNNVQNLGAQIQAAQIAVWILTNDSSMSNRFPTDPKKWTGNLDKYTYEEVGGMSDMIATLIECYNNPELNILQCVASSVLLLLVNG